MEKNELVEYQIPPDSDVVVGDDGHQWWRPKLPSHFVRCSACLYFVRKRRKLVIYGKEQVFSDTGRCKAQAVSYAVYESVPRQCQRFKQR